MFPHNSPCRRMTDSLLIQVLDELLSRFIAGIVPHFFVVKTLGDFTTAHSLVVAPRLNEIMNKVIPVLGAVKQVSRGMMKSITQPIICRL